ncbi:MAG: NAD(P)-dependent oxidoreductase [Acidobacteria bacterium]|nr:NAD(P)-dependent oxidoreductase [Acidobacteriota bacterium]
MKILVTGASGFVGGRFMTRCQRREGLSLHGVARRPIADPHYTALDLSQPFDLPFAPDVVIHAAARATPWGRRSDYLRDNVDATRQVIEFCRRRSLPRLVYVSSSSVFYREGHQFGLTEDSPIGPRFVNDYAATKYAGEELVRAYPGPWVIVRPRAVFGPGDTVLFPRILAAARSGRLPLVTTVGPPAVGDLIYVDTLVDYLLAVATKPDVAGCYNLTNNQPVVIQDFLLDVFARLGLPAPTRRVSLRTAMTAAAVTEAAYRLLHLPGEPLVTRFGVGVFAWSKTFNVARAIADLGPPSVSLADGVEAFVRWQRKQPA